MLRYLVFYFEDRRNLVWDPSAQRQLLRMLFLPPDVAQRWTRMERSILENDSRMRNLQAVVGKEETLLSRALAKKSEAGPLRAELQALEAVQEPDRNRLEEIEGLVGELDRRRQNARLEHLRAKQERETRFRAVEYARYVAIGARFPDKQEVGRYILAHLISENDCLVCGSHAPESAEGYAQRLSSSHCVVCNSLLASSEHIVEVREVADERIAIAEGRLEAADRELTASAEARDGAEREYDQHTTEMTRLRSKITARATRIDEIVELLPPSEAELRRQRVELSSIRGRLATMKSDLSEERATFGDFVEQCTERLLSSSEAVVAEFAEFAQSFMSEDISLTWTSRPAAVGQGGEAIPFPAFELNLSGSDFLGTVRRGGPDDVSESQREFIDLSFRMALMRAAGPGGAGLVIDTPESSLDAVFAERAGHTLKKFGEGRGNTLLVTSNLTEGNLLSTLIEAIKATPEKRRRLVDLFDVARPTAAVVAEGANYGAVRDRLFGSL